MLSSATVPLIAENKSLRDENADLAKRIAALEQRELPSLEGYVTAETAKSLVTDAVATAIAEIPVPQDGKSIDPADVQAMVRSEEHTSELQSLMRISYSVICLKKKN